MTPKNHIPPLMRARKRILKSGKTWIGYYFEARNDAGKRIEIALGTDYGVAIKKWAELSHAPPPPTNTHLMKYIFDRYEKEVLPLKAIGTQKTNLQELKQLRKSFNNAPIDALRPMHIAEYRRNRSAKVRANREMSLLSAIYNYAIEWGLTEMLNPTKGVRKNKENPRSFYANDEVWGAIRESAEPALQDAMDLAFLTGQRPGDVFKMQWTDISPDNVLVIQGKTGKRLRILIEGEFSKLIERIRSRTAIEGYGGTIIAVRPYRAKNSKAIPLSKQMLHDRLAKAKEKSIAIAMAAKNVNLVSDIKQFRFSDSRSKAASDIADLSQASKLLGHSKERITREVYRRNGEYVSPTR